jgi:hypothetical protein
MAKVLNFKLPFKDVNGKRTFRCKSCGSSLEIPLDIILNGDAASLPAHCQCGVSILGFFPERRAEIEESLKGEDAWKHRIDYKARAEKRKKKETS